MSQKRVLAILGSPHADGITAVMLKHSIAAAEEAGYVVTRINLYEKSLAYCTGCRACLKTEQCV